MTCEKTTTGRGAKPNQERPTNLLQNPRTEPILTALEASVRLQYRRLVMMPLPEIVRDLKRKNKNTKGKALEALAFYTARLLDLHFVQWRLRSSKSGGAELNGAMESGRLLFSRWLIQCQNTARASREDIAKELAIAQVIKASVVLIVCTGKISAAARKIADQVMISTNLYVALMDGSHLQSLIKSPALISQIMNTQAQGAMIIGHPQATNP